MPIPISLALASLLLIADAVAAAAEPINSLAGTLPESANYDEVLDAIDGIGAEATSLTLFWDDLQSNGEYVADPDWPAIAQLVYPANGLRIQLTFATIDTVVDRRPAHLQGLAWDDPRTVDAFKHMAQDALARMPDVDLVSIAIGNEVDGLLRRENVEEYSRFFEQAREAIRSLRPDVPVTVKTTWPGLRDRAEIRDLARLGDAFSITWYPMDERFHFADPELALQELPAMAKLADGPWELSEVGYPSDGCGASSRENQAHFHIGLRDATETYPHLQLIQRVWSHDISPQQVAAYLSYYDTDTPCFSSFLSSLGLRTNTDGTKPSYTALLPQ